MAETSPMATIHLLICVIPILACGLTIIPFMINEATAGRRVSPAHGYRFAMRRQPSDEGSIQRLVLAPGFMALLLQLLPGFRKRLPHAPTTFALSLDEPTERERG